MKERSVSYKSRYILREQLNQRNLPHFTVYKATQDGLERDVELRVFKVKATDGENTALKRFKREYQILARLDHPNIIKILDLGTEHDRAYYVTDLREAKSIAEQQKEGKDLFEISEVLKIGKEIGKALSYIHGRGLLHRDISADNIFYDENNHFYYIGSFSQGKEVIDKEITSRGVPFLSPLIATPEILQSLPVDNRTDIYLLGQMMYQLLTGRKQPAHYNDFEKETLDITSLDVRPVTEYNPQVPQSVDTLIRTMICLKPEKRFQNCLEFLKELNSVQRKLESIQTIRLNQQKLVRQRAKQISLAETDGRETDALPPENDYPDDKSETSFTLRDYLNLVSELPGALKYGLLLSLLPFIGTALFLYSSEGSENSNPMRSRTLTTQHSESAYFGKVGTSTLTKILALKNGTTSVNFNDRYDLIAKYRRSFPHKDRKNIVSYNELIESRVTFYKDAATGCQMIDKVIESLRARSK